MALPSQVSPPQLALSDVAPSHVVGADVVAVPVLAAAADEDGPTLGPGAAELMEELGEDLFALLEAGRPPARPVRSPSGSSSTPPA